MIGKLQRVKFSRDKGRGGQGRKKNPQQTQKIHTTPKPACSENVMTLSQCGVKPGEHIGHIAICQDSPGFC